MSRAPENEKRGVSAWATAKASNRSHCKDGRLTMPVILHTALEECGVPIEDFIARVGQRSLWQDDAIRSLHCRLIIQAHLARDGLRCTIQIGREAFYGYPANVLHLFHVMLPATVMATRDIAAACVIEDPLFQMSGILVRKIRLLRERDPEMGIALLLDTPSTSLSDLT